ncbi:MAG: glutamate mutase L [Chloroflexota bacterium]|nr:glutamate mutase L [Chloroflexota bacterium]
MAEEQHIGSILLADCGTVTTKAVLLEQVAGQYRFVARGEAPTTAEHPWADVAEDIRHAVEQISEVTGRRFFDASGDLISPELAGRQGVDVFAATSSASQPLKVVLGGLVRDLSVASVERAAAGTYSLVEAILANGGRKGKLRDEEHVRTIRDAAPDVICIAGGTDGGATTPVLELVKTVTLACSMIDASVRPRMLYAGNSQLRRRVVKLMKGQTELRVADNVRPTLTEENLFGAQAELDALYVQNKMGLLPGIETVSSWSSVPLTPTASAFGRLVQYLWHLGDPSKGVLGVDVGGANTTISAVFDGQPHLTIQGGLGAAFGGEQLLQRRRIETITRWLPEPMSSDDVHGLLINKEMRPSSVQQEQRELWLEQALTREVIRTTLEIARPGWKPGAAQPYPHLMPLCDTIIVSGGILAHAPRPGQAALVVLDGLEPTGVSTLVLDVHELAPALGNVATVNPLAAVEALDSGALVNLATVIAPVGRARRGDMILKVKVTYDDGSMFDVEVHYGDLEVLPLLPGQQAVLELRPLRRFDVGLGGPGKAGKRRVSGGLVGLIIDARGRPLRLPSKPEQRQNQMRQWLWDVGG